MVHYMYTSTTRDPKLPRYHYLKQPPRPLFFFLFLPFHKPNASEAVSILTIFLSFWCILLTKLRIRSRYYQITIEKLSNHCRFSTKNH